MGFFSWECKCCGESMKSGNDWMGQVVIVSDDDSVVRGEYDGYGRVNGRMGELDLQDASGEFACYHAACYALAGKPDYDGPSHSANDQGCGESEVEPKSMADVEAIKVRRAARDAEAKASWLRYKAERQAEAAKTGEELPDWLS